MRFSRDIRGFVGSEKSLLILLALGLILMITGVIRWGSQHAAMEAKKELEQRSGGPPSGGYENRGGGSSGTASPFSRASNPLGIIPSSLEQGRPYFDPEDTIRHDAVRDHFATVIRPGAETEVSISGSGPSGGVGRADIVDGNQIWEVKPAKPWWMDGTGQAQLNRYLEHRPGSVPGRMYNEPFTLPDPTNPNKELVVQSYGQPGMLYYYSRNRREPDRKPVPVLQPAPQTDESRERIKKAAIATGATVGGGVILWWAGKLLSPACGPAVVLCAIVF